MSLLRVLPRAPLTLGRQCMRAISSSSGKGERQPDAFDIVGIMGSSSPNRNHPSDAAPRKRERGSGLSATGMAGKLGMDRQITNAQMEEQAKLEAFKKQQYRRWNQGDVYAPHDLSGVEQRKWKTSRRSPQSDAFDVLGINPINEYKNYTMMSEFMTEMGRIRHSKLTGLRPVNQRKIAKAIRRAIGLGLMPSVHRHPLVLKKGGTARFV